MDIANHLEQLCHGFPDCTTVVLADLDAGLILGANAGNVLPQEHLNGIGLIAADLLNSPGLFGLENLPQIGTAILQEETQICVFIREYALQDVAICCIGSSELDTLGVTQLARSLLADLVSQE